MSVDEVQEQTESSRKEALNGALKLIERTYGKGAIQVSEISAYYIHTHANAISIHLEARRCANQSENILDWVTHS